MRSIFKGNCWIFYSFKPCSGPLRQPQLALVHGVCRGQSLAIGVYQLVPNDVDIEKMRGTKLGSSEFDCRKPRSFVY